MRGNSSVQKWVIKPTLLGPQNVRGMELGLSGRSWGRSTVQWLDLSEEVTFEQRCGRSDLRKN